MARFMRWACLIIGIMMLVAVGALIADVARLMAPFGGIPWSWNLLAHNIRWVVIAAAGLFLVGLSACLFVRARRAIAG